MKIELTIPGIPVGKGRPRFASGGHAYTPEKTHAYETAVCLAWKAQSGKTFPAGVPILAGITAYFPIPKSYSKRKAAQVDGAYHISRPDADNIAKSVLDALNQHAYQDDSAVQIAYCRKLYTGGDPRVELKLWTPEEDSTHGTC